MTPITTTITFPSSYYAYSNDKVKSIEQFKNWLSSQNDFVLNYFDVCYTKQTVYLKSKRFYAYTTSKIDGYNPEKAIVFRSEKGYVLDSNMVAKLVKLVNLDNELAQLEESCDNLSKTIIKAIADMRVKFPEFMFDFNSGNVNTGAFTTIMVSYNYVTITFFQDSNKHLPKMKVKSYKRLNELNVGDLLNFTKTVQGNSDVLGLAVPEIMALIPKNFWKA